MKRKIVACLALAALSIGIGATALSAQEKFPWKAVRVLVPYAPGGATDIVARLVAEQMRVSLGQSFVVENKPGAFGIIAIEEMVRSKPDGHTLMVGNISTNAITPVLFKKKFKIDYDKEVVAVSNLADLPSFLVVTTKDFAPTTIKEFIDYARAHPDTVRYASAGIGSSPHFNMEIFARQAGIKLVHIPNKAGASGYLADLGTGDVQIASINVATSGPQVRAGRLRALATNAPQRLEDYPDIPTMAELGFSGSGSEFWQAMFAPAETPKDVLATLHGAAVAALKSEPVVMAFKKSLIRATPSESPEQAQDWLRGELRTWRRISKEFPLDIAD